VEQFAAFDRLDAVVHGHFGDAVLHRQRDDAVLHGLRIDTVDDAGRTGFEQRVRNADEWRG
jgi:hypothetical protein